MSTPIDRYIPPDMTLEYVTSQLRRFLDRDARGMFEQVIRDNGGLLPPPPANATERCRQLQTCPEWIKPGRRVALPGRT